MRLETHCEVEESGGTAVVRLASVTGLSKQKIKQAMQKGAVWLTHGKTLAKSTKRIRRASKALEAGDTLHLYYDEQILVQHAPVPDLVADEGSYSIWNKPYGLRSQGSKWGDHCTINRYVEQNLTPQRPAFIVHRLDRAAKGLIIIAHSKTMARAFSKLFQERKITKRYRAKVHGCFPDGEPVTLDTSLDDKAAVSHVLRLAYDAESDRSELQVEIETGRKHQIRRHLAQAGFALINDRLYGSKDNDGDLQLTSYELEFESPVDGEIKHYCLDKPQLSG